MKTALQLIALAAAGLAVAAMAVGFGDRQTLVPPPESVAEGIGRALAGGQYEIAAFRLSDSLERATGAESLRTWFEPTRRRLGPASGVDAWLEWMDGQHAAARVAIEARGGRAVLHLRFTRERGLWKVESLPADVAFATNPRAR